MSLMIAAITLFAMLMVGRAEADSDRDLRLAKMFSPILILTEETNTRYDETVPIRVIKPEPVSIVGATNISYMWFDIRGVGQGNYLDPEYFNTNDLLLNQDLLSKQFYGPTSPNRFNFDQNKFAFLKGLNPFNFIVLYGSENMPSDDVNYPDGKPYIIDKAYFDYPGETASEWNNTYFGTGTQVEYPISLSNYRGENHPNTAYVHIYDRTIDEYSDTYDSVTVIQYKYFYPYNDWWNNHEGDWQGIDVVVSSRNPDTAEFLGVEYSFHKVWLSYYKDYSNKPGITDSFVFNAVGDVRLAAGTHPLVYIGAGSHASYPIGGHIKLASALDILEEVIPGGPRSKASKAERLPSLLPSRGDWEYMSHTGLVLSTLADDAPNSNLWESYNLVLLPDYNTHNAPDTTNTNNMGLNPDMSWLGAQIWWGTPEVNAPVLSSTLSKRNDSGPRTS